MARSTADSRLQRIVAWIHRIEDGLLVGLLLTMLVMAATQIFLRNAFDSAIDWADGLVRNLVLWLGLLGAMIASRNGNHICINVLARYLPERIGNVTDMIIQLVTAGICGMVGWHAVRFVRMEYEFGTNAFANIPTWVCEAIIPVAFGVIAIRYVILAVISYQREFHTRK